MALFPDSEVVVCVYRKRKWHTEPSHTHCHRGSLESADPAFFTEPKQHTELFRFMSLLGFTNTLKQARMHFSKPAVSALLTLLKLKGSSFESSLLVNPKWCEDADRL